MLMAWHPESRASAAAEQDWVVFNHQIKMGSSIDCNQDVGAVIWLWYGAQSVPMCELETDK